MSAVKKTFFSLASMVITGPVAHVQAQQMEIDFYADVACALYAGQVEVSWAGFNAFDNCFNYNQGLSTNIAACYEAGCHCIFYTGMDCEGASTSAIWTGHNCVPNFMNYNSFSCAFR